MRLKTGTYVQSQFTSYCMGTEQHLVRLEAGSQSSECQDCGLIWQVGTNVLEELSPPIFKQRLYMASFSYMLLPIYQAAQKTVIFVKHLHYENCFSRSINVVYCTSWPIMRVAMNTEACKVISSCCFVNSSHVRTPVVSYNFKQKFEAWWDMQLCHCKCTDDIV